MFFLKKPSLVSGVEMGVFEVPLQEVNIKSCLINGNFVIGMRPSLPVEEISLILGNDLEGERVMVDPKVVEKPRDDEKMEIIHIVEFYSIFIGLVSEGTWQSGAVRW